MRRLPDAASAPTVARLHVAGLLGEGARSVSGGKQPVVRATAWTDEHKRGTGFSLALKIGRKKQLAKLTLYPAEFRELPASPPVEARYVQGAEDGPFPVEQVEAFASALFVAVQRWVNE